MKNTLFLADLLIKTGKGANVKVEFKKDCVCTLLSGPDKEGICEVMYGKHKLRIKWSRLRKQR